MAKSRSQMSAEEMRNYIDSYFATVDSVNAALAKFESLAAAARTPEDRSRYNAEVLGARRELELLTNKRRAFQADRAAVNPPSADAVERVKQLSRDVATAANKAGQFEAVLTLLANALGEFASIHA